jgi:hypothetical protein
LSNNETWKPVSGYDGYYEVSSNGRVRSLDRIIDHPLVQVRHGKMLKQTPNHKGYMRVSLNKNGNKKQEFVHKLVAQSFIYNIKRNPQINHIDGNKLNNNVENLEWCTNKENCQHAAKLKLRSPIKGSSHHNTVLSEEQVIDLKQKRKEGWSYLRLMSFFNITKNNVASICTGRTWKHLNIMDGVEQ